jgi:heme-degrading monooxygenase HmoA
MVASIATLSIVPGKEEEFERQFAQRGRGVIESARGSHEVTIGRGVESRSTFSLIVEWDSVDAHHEAMKDPTYWSWVEFARTLYSERPQVQHFVIG